MSEKFRMVIVVDKDLHKELLKVSQKQDESLSKFVRDTLKRRLKRIRRKERIKNRESDTI